MPVRGKGGREEEGGGRGEEGGRRGKGLRGRGNGGAQTSMSLAWWWTQLMGEAAGGGLGGGQQPGGFDCRAQGTRIRSLSLPWAPEWLLHPPSRPPVGPPCRSLQLHPPAAHREVGHGVVVGLQHLGVLEDVIPKCVEPVERDEELGAGDPVLGGHRERAAVSREAQLACPWVSRDTRTDRPRSDAFQGHCRSPEPACRAPANPGASPLPGCATLGNLLHVPDHPCPHR